MILRLRPVDTSNKSVGGKQHGFTLLEVLISMVIVALGLLGLAGLQAVSLKNGNTAYLRSQATLLSHDVVERMRVNRTVALAGTYNIAIGATAGGSGVAGTDLSEWKRNLSQSLPAGDGSVAVTGVGGAQGNVQITVQWDDDGDGTPTSFVMQTRL
jgi:type IV pilus assembly protein PilV